MVNNDGILYCFETAHGRLVWRERIQGGYRSSPLAAEGRLYLVNTKGLTTVVTAGRRFERLAENQLDDEIIASPAVSNGRLFFRGRTALYCLGGPTQ